MHSRCVVDVSFSFINPTQIVEPPTHTHRQSHTGRAFSCAYAIAHVCTVYVNVHACSMHIKYTSYKIESRLRRANQTGLLIIVYSVWFVVKSGAHFVSLYGGTTLCAQEENGRRRYIEMLHTFATCVLSPPHSIYTNAKGHDIGSKIAE